MSAYLLNCNVKSDWQMEMLQSLSFLNQIFISNINNILIDGKWSVLIYFNENTTERTAKQYRSCLKKELCVLYIKCDKKNYTIQQTSITNNFTQYNNITTIKAVNVLVFDMDDTLINKDDELIADKADFIYGFKKLRDIFNYIGIWSHGNNRHVEQCHRKELNDIHLDFVISRDANLNEQGNKSLIRILRILNKNYNVGSINFSVLVDDNSLNFNNDYSLFIEVKRPIKNFQHFFKFINGKYVKFLNGNE